MVLNLFQVFLCILCRASSTACAILYMFFVKEPHVPEKKLEKKVTAFKPYK